MWALAYSCDRKVCYGQTVLSKRDAPLSVSDKDVEYEETVDLRSVYSRVSIMSIMSEYIVK